MKEQFTLTVEEELKKKLDGLVAKRNMERGCLPPLITRNQIVNEAIERLIDFEAMGEKKI